MRSSFRTGLKLDDLRKVGLAKYADEQKDYATWKSERRIIIEEEDDDPGCEEEEADESPFDQDDEEDVDSYLGKLNEKIDKEKSEGYRMRKNIFRDSIKKDYEDDDLNDDNDKEEIEDEYYNPKEDESESMYQSRYINGVDIVKQWLDNKKHGKDRKEEPEVKANEKPWWENGIDFIKWLELGHSKFPEFVGEGQSELIKMKIAWQLWFGGDLNDEERCRNYCIEHERAFKIIKKVERKLFLIL
jgi:hypothetical protein